jgi:hypothetical protein
MAEVTALPTVPTKVSAWSLEVVRMLVEDGATDSEVIVACVDASLRLLKARQHLDGKTMSTRLAALELVGVVAEMARADSGDDRG